MNALRARLKRANRLLLAIVPLDPIAGARISGKAEGVRLALSYLREDRQTLIPRLLDLHARRPGTWFKDGMSHGQTEWPDRCDHCRADWPCETVRIIEDET